MTQALELKPEVLRDILRSQKHTIEMLQMDVRELERELDQERADAKAAKARAEQPPPPATKPCEETQQTYWPER